MKRDVIAQGPVTMIETCGCGALYLTIGPLCMKLDAGVLPELQATLRRAVHALGTYEGGAGPSVTRGDGEN